MTQATDVDLREIKTAIETNTRSIESIRLGTEANTRAIEAIVRATEANTKAISDLTIEMRVCFADVKGQINTVEAKIEGKIDKVDAKYEERTKLGFWGFIFRGSALAVLAALVGVFVKYLFPVLPIS
jgi:copper chaperone CopZ